MKKQINFYYPIESKTMIEIDEKKYDGSGTLKSENLFIDSAANFNRGLYKDEPAAQLIDKLLSVYLQLPGSLSSSLFYLDQNTFEFHLGHVIGGSEELHQQIFDSLIERGIVAETLEKGKVMLSAYKGSEIIIVPLLSTEGILGIIQLVCNNEAYQYSNNLYNYIYLHANQFSFLLANAKLNKEINNLEAELEQKISLRVEKIKEAQRELQLILNSILTGVFIIEKSTGIILNVNDAAVEMLNCEKDLIIGTKRNEWEYFENLIIPSKDKNKYGKAEETFLLNAQKKPFPVLRTINNLLIGSKDIYLESFVDISDRKKYENDLQRQAELLEGVDKATNALLVESSFSSSITKSLKYLCSSTNVERVSIYKNVLNENSNELQAVREYYWCNETSAEFDKRYDVLSYKNELKEWYDILSKRESVSGVVNKFDYNIKRLLKRIGIKSLLVIPIYVENKFWGLLCFDDLTNEKEWTCTEETILKAASATIGGAIERYQSRLQLIQAVERAEEADRSDKLKSEFLAQMSHEIRTPINSILSFTSILKQEFEDNLTEDLKNTFTVISKAGLRIIRTVDLILNMSELQTGVYEYRECEFDLAGEILETIYTEFHTEMTNKNLRFCLNNYCERTLVKADKYSVSQIFKNLVDNALKFTDRGAVDINIKYDNYSRITVEVCDTGIGISANYIPQIYEAFSQEEHGYTRKYEGSGLGLSVVKKFCDLNKLAIQIESQKGIGSKFIITFP